MCCKELYNRVELPKFHPALQQYMEVESGCKVSVLNGATANGNRTVAQLKAERALECLAAVNTQVEASQQQLHTTEVQAEVSPKMLEEINTKLETSSRKLESIHPGSEEKIAANLQNVLDGLEGNFGGSV